MFEEIKLNEEESVITKIALKRYLQIFVDIENLVKISCSEFEQPIIMERIFKEKRKVIEVLNKFIERGI